VTGPLWIIVDRGSVTPDPTAGVAHADAHSRALCGVAGDVSYIAAFTHTSQAERFLSGGLRRHEHLDPIPLETTAKILEFLQKAQGVGQRYLGLDRESEGGPARLVAIADLLEVARRRLSEGTGASGVSLRPETEP
jgi:hypothetical protein